MIWSFWEERKPANPLADKLFCSACLPNNPIIGGNAILINEEPEESLIPANCEIAPTIAAWFPSNRRDNIVLPFSSLTVRGTLGAVETSFTELFAISKTSLAPVVPDVDFFNIPARLVGMIADKALLIPELFSP